MYVLMITYSFDADYICIECESEESAGDLLRKYINAEYKTIKEECEYEPIIWQIDGDEEYQVIWYTPHSRMCGFHNGFGTDYAEYRVINTNHNYL